MYENGSIITQHPELFPPDHDPNTVDPRLFATHVYEFSGIEIIGSGSYFPQRIYTAEENIAEAEKKGLLKKPMTPERIFEILGTWRHHVAANNELPSDMIVNASIEALKNAGILIPDIKLGVFAPVPGDRIGAETGPIVRTKMRGGFNAYNIGHSCDSWHLAMEDAMLRMLATKNSKQGVLDTALVAAATRLNFIGVEQYANPIFKSIFGDGAAAVVLRMNDSAKRIWTITWTGAKGDEGESIYFSHEWSVAPSAIPEQFKDCRFYMGDGKIYFSELDNYLPPLLEKLWKISGMTAKDIDFAVIHEPSTPLHRHSVGICGIEPSVTSFETKGNLVAVEMPYSIDLGLKTGKLKKGMSVLMFTYGAGFTIGLMLIESF